MILFLIYCYKSLRIIQHQNFKIKRISYAFLCFPHPAIFKQIYLKKIFKTAILNAIFTKMDSKFVLIHTLS